jgi:pyruvate dehydrogenase E2 component (dihydrolipoamide acetyltransferase)
MPIPVAIPRLGWAMEEGTFVEWLKADGVTVRPGDAVFRLEGEKATEEVESLDGGTLHIPPYGPKPGDRISVGTVIGFLMQAGEVVSALASSAPTQSREGEAGEAPAETPIAQPGSAPASPSRDSPTITPRARRLAGLLKIDWSKLNGSGRTGRIRERDVAALAGSSPALADRTIPFTPIRKAIAARMVESRQTTAPVTLTSIVDATNLVNLRGQFTSVPEIEPIPSYTDLLVKLTAVALQKHPLLAARWSEAGLVIADRIDIGIAVDTDAGLLVPVIRDVPSLGLRQVAGQSRELIDRARTGMLSMADMRGGVFTITNLGAFGIDAFTPIINPPECAVLGVGRIERRPVMDGDRVVGRELVTLSLTFDHRIVDGGPAARFLQTLARCIENPGPWLSS